MLQMFWGKFFSAIADLEAIPTAYPEYRAMADCMRDAQFFYMPDGKNIIEGVPIDAEMKTVLRLPFPITAVLSESYAKETGDKIDVISLVIASDEAARRKYMDMRPFSADSWLIASLVFDRQMKKWVASMGFGIVQYPNNKDGFSITMGKSPLSVIADNFPGMIMKMLDDFRHDINVVQNLCLMLSLHNVESVEAKPPEKLNKARIKRNKPPLRSFHVLKVNGQIWDTPQQGGSSSEGYRSHFRRGHIRKLEDGRRIWVSSSFVKGRQPGFVDKAYVGKP